MARTHPFHDTVVAQARQDPAFARGLLDEAADALLNGEPGVARLLLRDLVNATLGFERLSRLTGTPSKSLHRMLSAAGNPSMDNLAAIIDALRHQLKVKLKTKTVAAA